jgi:hypothetical protein
MRTGRHLAGVPMKKKFPLIPFGPSLTYGRYLTVSPRFDIVYRPGIPLLAAR